MTRSATQPYGPPEVFDSWTVEDAAEIIGLPSLTLRQWVTLGLVVPSVPLEQTGGGQPGEFGIGLIDLAAFRLAGDLLSLGVPRDVVRPLARELQDPGAGFLPWRDLWREGWWLVLPTDADLCEVARQRDSGALLTVFQPAQVEAALAEGGWTTVDHLPVLAGDEGQGPAAVLWPLSEVMSETIDAVELWRIRKGVSGKQMPPWL